MATTGLSLALVLLQANTPYATSAEANTYEQWQTTRDDPTQPPEVQDAARDKLMQVQASLYKALYQIIEDYEDTPNKALNLGIGRALAETLTNRSSISSSDTVYRERIDRLIGVLKPVVTEAVKAVRDVEQGIV